MKFIQYSLMIAGVVGFTSCLKSDPNPADGVVNDFASVYAVRESYHGTAVTLGPSTLSGASKMVGVVISDAAGKNVAPGTFMMQGDVSSPNQLGDITRGIVVDLGASSVPVGSGDSVAVDIMGAKLESVNGRLVVSNVKADNITKLKSMAAVTIRYVTLNMLNTYKNDFESSLVTVHADAKNYNAGATLAGEHILSDNSGSELVLFTRNDAGIAGEELPINAGYTGIFTVENGKNVIALRTADDIKFKSGALYAGFPESFESPDFSQKASYNMTATQNNIDLSTGNWKLQQAILGNTLLRDKFNYPGKQCVRMQQNLSSSGYVQMNFDLPQGASKVTVFYGKYYTDPTSTFRLEYSTDGGTTWKQTGADVKDMPDRGSKQAVFTVNFAGNIRFRINKRGLGTSSNTNPNGRLCIEDIAIYKAL